MDQKEKKIRSKVLPACPFWRWCKGHCWSCLLRPDRLLFECESVKDPTGSPLLEHTRVNQLRRIRSNKGERFTMWSGSGGTVELLDTKPTKRVRGFIPDMCADSALLARSFYITGASLSRDLRYHSPPTSRALCLFSFLRFFPFSFALWHFLTPCFWYRWIIKLFAVYFQGGTPTFIHLQLQN